MLLTWLAYPGRVERTCPTRRPRRSAPAATAVGLGDTGSGARSARAPSLSAAVDLQLLSALPWLAVGSSRVAALGPQVVLCLLGQGVALHALHGQLCAGMGGMIHTGRGACRFVLK